MSHTDDTDFICVPRISVASQGFNHHRNLDGIYTDVLGVAYGKKSLEEIFNEIWPLARNNLKFREAANKIFNKKSRLKMRSNTSLLGEGFILDRLRLEI